MLVRKEPETATLCPPCGDAMRLARKLPSLRVLAGFTVHLCGQCGYVEATQCEPEPPPPKWRPTRIERYAHPPGSRSVTEWVGLLLRCVLHQLVRQHGCYPLKVGLSLRVALPARVPFPNYPLR